MANRICEMPEVGAFWCMFEADRTDEERAAETLGLLIRGGEDAERLMGIVLRHVLLWDGMPRTRHLDLRMPLTATSQAATMTGIPSRCRPIRAC